MRRRYGLTICPVIAEHGVHAAPIISGVLTAMSPLQYQKQLRLQAARGRMHLEGVDAASAAFEVGYESASQFSREYSRFSGEPPMGDIRGVSVS